MATYNNLTTKVSGSSYKRANIFDLINKVKYEEKKEKRNSIIYIVAAVSALAVSGLVISL